MCVYTLVAISFTLAFFIFLTAYSITNTEFQYNLESLTTVGVNVCNCNYTVITNYVTLWVTGDCGRIMIVITHQLLVFNKFARFCTTMHSMLLA